jgi:hypothetical protein
MTTAALPAPDPELIEAAASGHLVIMVGAGASYGSGLPLWSALVEKLFTHARAAATPQQEDELSQAAAWFAKEGELLDKASSSISRPPPQRGAGGAYRSVGRLGFLP